MKKEETMSQKNDIVSRAFGATRESRYIEFKTQFDPSQKHDWCELLKDIMAIVNGGGGVILFGLDNKGIPSGKDLTKLLELDPAQISDKIHSYTNVDYNDFELGISSKNNEKVVFLRMQPSSIPLTPIRPGTYEKESGKQESAFSVGVLYYRHGAKSEPGTSADIVRIIERRVAEIRKEWLGGVRKVVSAPRGSIVKVISKDVRVTSDPQAQPIREPRGTGHLLMSK